MRSHRFSAPKENRAKLLEPAPGFALQDIERNQKYLADTLGNWRSSARDEVLHAAKMYHRRIGLLLPDKLRDGPLILAGHQPELAHPGVWLKNYELHRLAQRTNGIGLNLIVDNDTLKQNWIRVPRYDATDPANVQETRVQFDTAHAEEPYESRRFLDLNRWNAFKIQVLNLAENWGFEPMLKGDWLPAKLGDRIGYQFTLMRLAAERDWGVQNLELPVSWLAKTAAFKKFTKSICGYPRFREVYNQAVQAYRVKHALKSRNHPVPDLAEDEAPFWINAETGPRQRLMVKGEFSEDVEIRPRALTLTLFARLVLGDYFIHGIGGAKYDEVTDTIIQEFFGLEPPEYMVVSGTLQLPLRGFPSTRQDVLKLHYQLRDMAWNPERHIPESLQQVYKVQSLVNDVNALIASKPLNSAGRKSRHQQLRKVKDRLWKILSEYESVTNPQAIRISLEVAANEVLQRRDYSWVLFPEAELRAFLLGP